jgi:hypothetical protein
MTPGESHVGAIGRKLKPRRDGVENTSDIFYKGDGGEMHSTIWVALSMQKPRLATLEDDAATTHCSGSVVPVATVHSYGAVWLSKENEIEMLYANIGREMTQRRSESLGWGSRGGGSRSGSSVPVHVESLFLSTAALYVSSEAKGDSEIF